MFYDKQSNNQVLRMQTMHTGQPIINEAEELKWEHHSILCFGLRYSLTLVMPAIFTRRFTGIEFALVHAQPPSLFIIHKRERLSPEEGMIPCRWVSLSQCQVLPIVRPLAAYFIMNSRIYQSPDLYSILSNRLVSVSFLFTKQFISGYTEQIYSWQAFMHSSPHWTSCVPIGRISHLGLVLYGP